MLFQVQTTTRLLRKLGPADVGTLSNKVIAGLSQIIFWTTNFKQEILDVNFGFIIQGWRTHVLALENICTLHEQ